MKDDPYLKLALTLQEKILAVSEFAMRVGWIQVVPLLILGLLHNASLLFN